jgi:hypothetical protein
MKSFAGYMHWFREWSFAAFRIQEYLELREFPRFAFSLNWPFSEQLINTYLNLLALKT